MDELRENERAALKELKARLARDFGLVELKLRLQSTRRFEP